MTVRHGSREEIHAVIKTTGHGVPWPKTGGKELFFALANGSGT
jgi:hypothetical protein